MDIFSPKEDFVFRKLFGDQNNLDMILSFLKTFVDLPEAEYTDVAISNPNLLPEVKDGKRCVLDLKLTTRSGEIINVEIQREDTDEMRERITVYAAKLLAEQLSSGEEYKTVHRVISVLITDFDLLKETKDYHTWFRLRDTSGKITLTEVLEVHTLELSKIPASEDDQKVLPWLKFLAAKTEEEFAMLQETYPELQKPVSRLIAMSADEVIRAQKDSWDKARWDEEARKHHAEVRAKAEGKAEARTEVAIKLLRQGLSRDVIAVATGLSLEEIAALPV